MVVKVEFHFVAERLSRCAGEHIWPHHLAHDIEWGHNGELLVQFRPVFDISISV